MRGPWAEFPPNAGYAHVNRPCRDESAAMDRRDDLTSRIRLAGMSGEEDEHGVFERCEGTNRSAVQRDMPRSGGEGKALITNGRDRSFAGAVKLDVDAGDQQLVGNGERDAVIRADGETGDRAAFVGNGLEHDDRRGGKFREAAKPAADFDAVHIRQPGIDEDQIGPRIHNRRDPGFAGRRGDNIPVSDGS